MGQTLGDILALLPDVGRERLAYNPNFWTIKANEVLSEIESSASGAAMTCESVIPLRPGRTMYRIPAEIRKVKRVRYPTDGALDLRDGTNWIDFAIVNSFLRILDASADPESMISGTVTGGTKEDVIATLPSAPTGENWVAIITHSAEAGGYGMNYGNYFGGMPSEYDGWVEYRKVIEFTDNGSGSYTIALDGELDLDPSGTIVLTNNFIIASGQRRFRRFVDLNTVSPLPDEWNHIIHKGLRWYMEVQNDEGNGESAVAFEATFRSALEAYVSETAAAHNDAGRIEPRGSLAWGMFS